MVYPQKSGLKVDFLLRAGGGHPLIFCIPLFFVLFTPAFWEVNCFRGAVEYSTYSECVPITLQTHNLLHGLLARGAGARWKTRGLSASAVFK